MDNEELNKRVEKLELIAEGKCPDCKKHIKDWKIPFGSFAPEIWASLRENGIDPVTGHSLTCKNK
jgi:hypothetical protein